MADPAAGGDPGGENIAGETPEQGPEAVTDETTLYEDDVELERTIRLVGGLAIGIGTMIGAGIFVFPGLAATEAGPAAALSFAIGGVIALLVALPTSELATAMPRSGGGYYFVSRSMGTSYGAIVGLGLWLALVFAVALTVLSVGGTENTATLQNVIVVVLLAILTGFLTYGVLDAAGVFGRQSVPGEFFSQGRFPVLTTAALVFTSYLGFAQVATVAGEIKKPSRNLPLAMVGGPILGAVASAGLIVFMNRASIVIGLAIMAGSYLWFRYYAAEVELRGDV